MVAVAETKQQRKLPHQLAKKNILFWPKVQAFGRKPVATHTDISAGGKEKKDASKKPTKYW